MHWIPTLLASYAILGGAGAFSSSGFDPRQYSKTIATCKAVKRNADHALVDIQLGYVDINPSGKKTVIMVHGWPSLWSTWSNQIEELKHDYRLIIPNLRGFGDSTHPDDVKTSGTTFDIVSDLSCILANAQVDNAICMGHDWGAQVCYEASRSRPDIFHGVIGITVPYIPAAGPFIPIKELVPMLPKLTYQLFFDSQTDSAVAELDRDIRRTLRATLRSKASPPPEDYLKSENSFMAAWDHIDEIPPMTFLSPEEEDYFVEEFSTQGFKNTLHFYTTENRHASWKHANEQGNHTIPHPVLAIYPKHDPVADWAVASRLLKSADFLPQLIVEMIDGAHWVHMENPKLVNNVIRKWLQNLEDPNRLSDEL